MLCLGRVERRHDRLLNFRSRESFGRVRQSVEVEVLMFLSTLRKMNAENSLATVRSGEIDRLVEGLKKVLEVFGS